MITIPVREVWSMYNDRLSFILSQIEEWKKQDTELRDKEGFLSFIKKCDFGQYPVGDTRVWMKYIKEAKKKRMTVKELVFEKRKEMLSKNIEFVNDPGRPLTERVSIIDEVKRKELKEMDKRLKQIDPARVKRLNK